LVVELFFRSLSRTCLLHLFLLRSLDSAFLFSRPQIALFLLPVSLLARPKIGAVYLLFLKVLKRMAQMGGIRTPTRLRHSNSVNSTQLLSPFLAFESH
jgi:hypothetical protein